MPDESGDMKLLGNLRKYIDFTAAASGYQPSNTLILKASMEAQYTAGLALIQGLSNRARDLRTAGEQESTSRINLQGQCRRAESVLLLSAGRLSRSKSSLPRRDRR